MDPETSERPLRARSGRSRQRRSGASKASDVARRQTPSALLRRCPSDARVSSLLAPPCTRLLRRRPRPRRRPSRNGLGAAPIRSLCALCGLLQPIDQPAPRGTGRRVRSIDRRHGDGGRRVRLGKLQRDERASREVNAAACRPNRGPPAGTRASRRDRKAATSSATSRAGPCPGSDSSDRSEKAGCAERERCPESDRDASPGDGPEKPP